MTESQACKKELKAAFPGTKFSVRGSRTSMNIKWTDGPTEEQVSDIAGKYKSVSRCEYSGEILGGGNFFVFYRRHYSLDIFTAKAREICGEYRGYAHVVFDELKIEETSIGVNIKNDPLDTDYGRHQYLSSHVLYELKDVDLREQPKVEVQAKKAVEAPEQEIDGVTVTLNEEKNGVEIRFSKKPSEQLREELKTSGYRWSRFGKLWYAGQTEETIKFAESLQNGEKSESVEAVPALVLVAEKPIEEAIEVPCYQVEIEPAPRTLALVASPSYQVITEPVKVAPVAIVTPQQELKQKLNDLDVNNLSAQQIQVILGALA